MILISGGATHLAIRFLEHCKSHKAATIVTVSSILGYVPTGVNDPVYNGSKAWIHFCTMNLRMQASKGERGKGIKIVKIAPPEVGAALQRGRSNLDENRKEHNPMR